MNLKSIVCSCLFFFCVATPCESWAQQPAALKRSCQTFVQSFYDWYLPRLVNETPLPAPDLALRDRSSAFSPELLHALRDDAAARASVADEIVGLDFDPFLNTQDPDSSYVLGRVMQKGNSCRVEVHGVASGQKRVKPDVIPELTYKHGRWMFVNFHYGKSKLPADENLVGILASLRRDRQKSTR
jgi:hypothetical protein